jgi:Cu/Ag efflux protein CusF
LSKEESEKHCLYFRRRESTRAAIERLPPYRIHPRLKRSMFWESLLQATQLIATEPSTAPTKPCYKSGSITPRSVGSSRNPQLKLTATRQFVMKLSRRLPTLKRPMCLLIFAALVVSCSRAPERSHEVAPSPSPSVAMTGPPGTSPAIVGKPYPGTGVVTLINLKEGWVEIDHEPIEGLMPAMQMEWTVEPRSLMKAIRVGDKVEFTVVETGKGEIITSIKRVPPR